MKNLPMDSRKESLVLLTREVNDQHSFLMFLFDAEVNKVSEPLLKLPSVKGLFNKHSALHEQCRYPQLRFGRIRNYPSQVVTHRAPPLLKIDDGIDFQISTDK